MTNILNLVNDIAATGPDFTKESKGGSGGTYTPPVEGVTRLRFVAYVEVGVVKRVIKGVPKLEDQCHLVFELSGPRHPAKVLESGEKVPFRITLKLNNSRNEKAKAYKLFKRMNYEGKATHFSQLLGQAFLGTVSHYKFTGQDGKEVCIAQLEGSDGITVRPPKVEDVETGEVRTVAVDAAISPIRLFVWNAKPEHIEPMWNSIFIEGAVRVSDTGVPGRDPNVFQAAIKKAENFVGSPISEYLASKGEVPSIPDAERVAKPKAPAIPAPAQSDDDLLDGVL